MLQAKNPIVFRVERGVISNTSEKHAGFLGVDLDRDGTIVCHMSSFVDSEREDPEIGDRVVVNLRDGEVQDAKIVEKNSD